MAVSHSPSVMSHSPANLSLVADVGLLAQVCVAQGLQPGLVVGAGGLADRDPSAADAAVRALDELEHRSASCGARRVQDAVHHRVDRLTAEEPAEFLHAVPPL